MACDQAHPYEVPFLESDSLVKHLMLSCLRANLARYEEAERRWREAHPDGEEPPMDSDNIVLGTIRNPNAGAKSAAQVAAEKRRILEKEASQQRWSMQSTVDPAVRTRALGGAMNAKFVKQRSAKTSKLIGAPLTASQIRPWRPSKKMSRAKAAAAAANAATIAQSGELEEADSSNDKSPLGTTESAAGVDDSHNVDAKLRSSQSSHSPARPGALALRSGSSSGENDHAQQLLVRVNWTAFRRLFFLNHQLRGLLAFCRIAEHLETVGSTSGTTIPISVQVLRTSVCGGAPECYR